MKDPGTDRRAAATEPTAGAPLSPAALAQSVAMLVDEDSTIRGARLPMWERLDVRPPSRLRSWWSRAALIVAWCVTLGMLVVAGLRIWSHDATLLLTWLNAFTLTIYLPAYFVLAFAAWKRRWLLVAASTAVVACHLTWVAPLFPPATPFVPPSNSDAANPSSLRVFYANVWGASREFDATLDEAMRADADVIVLAELKRPWIDYLETSTALKAYPYGTDLAKRHPGDVCVFSRLRVSRRQIISVAGRECIVVDIPLGSETVRLFCLHSPRPMFEGADLYSEFWQTVEPLLAEQTDPLVVIGDFNATPFSLVYQLLAAGPLRSAHDDRGRGYATTWPNGKWPVPPIRIDQAFLSPQVECVSIEEGLGTGSDHKPLILNLRVHPSGRPAEASTSGR